MPLVEHLRELRYRLAVSLGALAVVFVVAFVLRERVVDFFSGPYCELEVAQDDDGQCVLAAFTVTEQFSAVLRSCLIVSVVGSSPVWIYQVGRFLVPALHQHERRYVYGFTAASLIFFAFGCVFAFLVADRGLELLLTFAGDDVEPVQGLRSYLDFLAAVLLAFGVAFEMPVLVIFLHLIGVLPAQRMQDWRRGVILGIAVFTAVITPTGDPFTFLAMGVPLYVLYEVCIVIARVRERRGHRRRAAQGLAGLDDDEVSPTPEPASSVDVADPR